MDTMTRPHIKCVAEIGINHQGDLDKAWSLIARAKDAGFDFVKFQKRNPDRYPERPYESPVFGDTTYREHKRQLEFSLSEYEQIEWFCKDEDIPWTASPFDFESVDFLEYFDVPFYKIASPVTLNLPLVEYIAQQGKPVLMSTGMASMDEIHMAVTILATHLDRSEITLLHCNSEYPTPLDHVNLAFIPVLKDAFKEQIGSVGYSSHDGGVAIPVQAVGYGAEWIEVHVTEDRRQKGSDHACSLEMSGMRTLVTHVRDCAIARGSGAKIVYPGELEIKEKVMQANASGRLDACDLMTYLEQH